MVRDFDPDPGSGQKAGLDARCKAHGLRKAGMRRMAEGGASAKQLSAVSGHKTLKEVERYTAAADQLKLAKATLGMMAPAKKRISVANKRKPSV